MCLSVPRLLRVVGVVVLSSCRIIIIVIIVPASSSLCCIGPLAPIHPPVLFSLPFLLTPALLGSKTLYHSLRCFCFGTFPFGTVPPVLWVFFVSDDFAVFLLVLINQRLLLPLGPRGLASQSLDVRPCLASPFLLHSPLPGLALSRRSTAMSSHAPFQRRR